jgi:hypothetical protein
MYPELTIESFGLTKSPLDAYRGRGVHTKIKKVKPEVNSLNPTIYIEDTKRTHNLKKPSEQDFKK